jgi:hypothetical protein
VHNFTSLYSDLKFAQLRLQLFFRTFLCAGSVFQAALLNELQGERLQDGPDGRKFFRQPIKQIHPTDNRDNKGHALCNGAIVLAEPVLHAGLEEKKLIHKEQHRDFSCLFQNRVGLQSGWSCANER